MLTIKFFTERRASTETTSTVPGKHDAEVPGPGWGGGPASPRQDAWPRQGIPRWARAETAAASPWAPAESR